MGESLHFNILLRDPVRSLPNEQNRCIELQQGLGDCFVLPTMPLAGKLARQATNDSMY